MLRYIPNILTLGRIVLIFPFAYYLLQADYKSALVLFFIAGVSDGVDGFLARQFRWKSRFGAIADPLADKLLLMTAYCVLAYTQLLPVWLILVIVVRDLSIVAGALGYHFFIHRYEVKPTIWGKLCTFTQISFVLIMLVNLALYPLPFDFISAGVWLVAIITVMSGVHYAVTWTRRAWQSDHENDQSGSSEQ